MKLTKDLAQVTLIPEKRFNFLINYSIDLLANGVYETKLTGENITDIDLGLGVLYIKADGAEVKYKFVPSASLENSIRAALSKDYSPLVKNLDTSLVSHLLDTYKDLM